MNYQLFCVWRLCTKPLIGLLFALMLWAVSTATGAQALNPPKMCELHLNDRNLGLRPCLFKEVDGVKYVAFLNEEGTRIDLILAHKGDKMEVLYISEELKNVPPLTSV